MKASKPQSLLLALASAATTAALSFQAPAFAGDYAVKVECHGGDCYGIVFNQETGEEVDATEPQKNEKRAYRKAQKRLEQAEESGEGIVSEEWLRCRQDPAACGGL